MDLLLTIDYLSHRLLQNLNSILLQFLGQAKSYDETR